MLMQTCKGKAKVASPQEQKSGTQNVTASSGPCLEVVRLQVLKKSDSKKTVGEWPGGYPCIRLP